MIVRTVETEVRCDHAACQAVLIIESVMLLREKSLRLMSYRSVAVKARRRGWQIGVADRDLCPDHHI